MYVWVLGVIFFISQDKPVKRCKTTILWFEMTFCTAVNCPANPSISGDNFLNSNLLKLMLKDIKETTEKKFWGGKLQKMQKEKKDIQRVPLRQPQYGQRDLNTNV